MHALRRLAVMLVFCLAAGLVSRQGYPASLSGKAKDDLAYWSQRYERILPEQDGTGQVRRAHKIFAQVLKVADRGKKRRPELVVLNDEKKPHPAWALTLPAGHIILFQNALTACHQDGDIGEAEARLAFVLGHELAHLAFDDFLHQEILVHLKSDPDNPGRSRSFGAEESENRKKTALAVKGENELEADYRGFLYAAMAGYPVDRLRKDFFVFYMKQTHAPAAVTQPQLQARSAVIQKGFQELVEKLPLFDFGVRLSHFGRFDYAVNFFENFRNTYEGREVLNNVGYCYLQLARASMKTGQTERADLYWLTLTLDAENMAAEATAGTGRTRRLSLKGGGRPFATLKDAAAKDKCEVSRVAEQDSKACEYLRAAVTTLRQAAEADADYLPARINLAIGYLYLGQPSHAEAAIEEALAVAPDNPAIQGLKALILYERNDSDRDRAVTMLEELVTKHTELDYLSFNLARLLSADTDPEKARPQWDTLAGKADRLPGNIRTIVCGEQKALPGDGCGSAPTRDARVPAWQWPVPPTENNTQPDQATVEKALSGWERDTFSSDRLAVSIFRKPDGQAQVLVIDNRGVMQVNVITEEQHDFPKEKDLQTYCSETLHRRSLPKGTLWTCRDWAALVHGESVREIWKVTSY